MNRTKLIFLILYVFTIHTIISQELFIKGNVYNTEGDPLFLVAIYNQDKDKYTQSNQDGFFSFKINKSTRFLNVSCLGYVDTIIQIDTLSPNKKIVIYMIAETLKLDEVVVNATKNHSNKGTSVYKIKSQAIKQIQAVSLGDILSLLPGNELHLSDQNSTQQANIRTAVSSSANSFGTSIIVDGVMLSNDVNMQAKNPSSGMSGGKATTARGIDLRSISANNIESVEVVSGIASPRYGNLSSGIVIVKSKIGVQKSIISSNISPVSYQVGFTNGKDLNNNNGVLNTSFSYLFSNGSPIEQKTYYQNFNLGFIWSNILSETYNWNNTISIKLHHSDDGNRHEPDEVHKNEADIKNTRLSYSIIGDVSFLGKLNYSFYSTIERQYSYFDTTQINGPRPIVESLKSGTFFTTYTPLVYNQKKEIFGMPLTINTRLESSQKHFINNYSFLFETGAEFSYSKNYGKGRVSSGDIAFEGDIVGSRSAKFNAIPAAITGSLYHQTKIKRHTDTSKQEIRFGIRYDNMLGTYNLFSPRVSLSSTIIDHLSANVSYGISYKSPALLQIYPGPTYLDYTNLNYFSSNPKERLAIVSTLVFKPVNTDLEPSKSRMFELGLNFNSPNLTVQITGYKKELKNGIYHTPELVFIDKQNYTVVNESPNLPPDVIAIHGDISRLIRTIRSPNNNYSAFTDGIELIVKPPKIPFTNSEFSFRFAAMKTQEFDNGYNIKISNYPTVDGKKRFGVYENYSKTTYLSRGTLSLIQHLPDLGFVLSLSAELNFSNYSKMEQGSLYPYAYYDVDGTFHTISTANQDYSNYQDLKLSKNTYTIYSKPPFYTNFNIQIRKETANGNSFSFYANNFLWHNPTYEIRGARRVLNPDISVGFSMQLIF